jgi:hypothetical protein
MYNFKLGSCLLSLRKLHFQIFTEIFTEKVFYAKNVSKFIGKVPETVFAFKVFFVKKFPLASVKR